MTKKEEAEIEKALNLIKPLHSRSRSEWLELLHRLQNGDATCIFVLKEIEKELSIK
jgi:hypothetical protein